MIAKWLWHLKILDVTGLNPALHENVFWTDFAKISHSAYDEQMLKISRRYLHPYFSNDQLSEKLLQPMDPLWTLWPKVSKGGPFVATIFQLISHYSNMNQDIFLKFSAFVHHMSALNWQKNFCHCSIRLPATANFGQNLERL